MATEKISYYSLGFMDGLSPVRKYMQSLTTPLETLSIHQQLQYKIGFEDGSFESENVQLNFNPKSKNMNE